MMRLFSSISFSYLEYILYSYIYIFVYLYNYVFTFLYLCIYVLMYLCIYIPIYCTYIKKEVDKKFVTLYNEIIEIFFFSFLPSQRTRLEKTSKSAGSITKSCQSPVRYLTLLTAIHKIRYDLF